MEQILAQLTAGELTQAQATEKINALIKLSAKVASNGAPVRATATHDAKRNVLVVEIPLHDPRPSSTGKSTLVGNASGRTTVTLHGKPVNVSCSAFLK